MGAFIHRHFKLLSKLPYLIVIGVIVVDQLIRFLGK